MAHFFECLLTEKRVGLLMDGYFRELHSKTGVLIPNDLIALVSELYNEVVYYEMNKQESSITKYGSHYEMKYDYDSDDEDIVHHFPFRPLKVKQIYARWRIFCDDPYIDEAFIIKKDGAKTKSRDLDPKMAVGKTICLMAEIVHMRLCDGSHYAKHPYPWDQNDAVSEKEMQRFEESEFGKYFNSHCFGIEYSDKNFVFYLPVVPGEIIIGNDDLDLMLIPSISVLIIEDVDDDVDFELDTTKLLRELHQEIKLQLDAKLPNNC